MARRCRVLSTFEPEIGNRASFVKAIYYLSQRLNHRLATVRRIKGAR